MFAQDCELIENLLLSLKEDFLCADGGPADGCLGVEIKSTDGQLTLKQPQLIKWKIEILNLKDSNFRATAVVKPLPNKNSNDKHRIGCFHYRLTVGSLCYLEGCNLPDFSMPVNQADKISTNPKHSQDNEVKRIGNHVKGKKEKINLETGFEERLKNTC